MVFTARTNSNLDPFASYFRDNGKNFEHNIPARFVKINGVMQLNPEFKKYRDAQKKFTTTNLNPECSFPVVSNMGEYKEWCAASKSAGYGEVPMAKSTETAIQKIQEPKNTQKIGLSPDAILQDLGRIFAKHEAPIGLINKLLILSEFDELEFMIDDSGSMGQLSDTKDNLGRKQTRWEEAHSRIKEMLEILAYIPTPKITFCFLNRTNIIQLQRNGETPETFLQNAYKQLNGIFERCPQGSTPARKRLEQSLNKNQGKRVARYFFGDGEPDGGEAAKNAIAHMIKNRPDPKDNPITFLSCTKDDEQVEWMKTLEEEAPYCSEYDDFADEAREVLRDQGKVLPFTKGFHLIGQLVGAMCPDDIDAMDESIPFTKWTLDNLMGIQMSQEEYRCYFDGFKEAQRTRKIENTQDSIKSQFSWESLFILFVSQKCPAKAIDAVKNFRMKLLEA